MNNQEKKQWLADIYQQAADGGELQLRTGAGTWIDDHRGPALGNDRENWRIKPALKVIDMSVMIGTGLDCEFWDAFIHLNCMGRLTHKSKEAYRPYCLNGGTDYAHCQPRMTPYIHFWSGGGTCPVPEGFDVRLHIRKGHNIKYRHGHHAWESKARISDISDISDIIGIEFIGIKDGYTLEQKS